MTGREDGKVAAEGENMSGSVNSFIPRGFLAWLAAVAGWLLCAAMCLWLIVELEAWPYAYDMFFPAVILVLFCNILLFLFVAGRWSADVARLFGSVARICIGEFIILAGMYIIARYCM